MDNSLLDFEKWLYFGTTNVREISGNIGFDKDNLYSVWFYVAKWWMMILFLLNN